MKNYVNIITSEMDGIACVKREELGMARNSGLSVQKLTSV